MEVDNSTAQVDNSSAPVVDGAANAGVIETPASSTDARSIANSWKSNVRNDLKDSPLLQKFEDTPDGLNKALESHANLEKLLGHEKVPIPKDINDVEGWNRFSKAMGIPDKAENYGLPDASLPDSMKGITIDKNKFAEVVHAHKLTPAQAQGLWKAYNEINTQTYQTHMESHQKQLASTVSQLKGEWGDAYNTNVELAQTVINKFASTPETNDYLTATLTKDPQGIKFLAKIGEQFAENKVGEFQMKRFSLAPEQADNEIQKILRDPNHAYTNPKATDAEHEAAIQYVNSLYATKLKGQA